jgi:hypothetical protein
MPMEISSFQDCLTSGFKTVRGERGLLIRRKAQRSGVPNAVALHAEVFVFYE